MALDYLVIGERIRKSRIENKLTQENLAEKLNVSVAFISRIERGSAHVNLTRLSEICAILNIDEGTILNGTSTESTNYLSDEFNELFKNCSKQTQRLIYDIAKLIINETK
ncbi:MAG: helix-turn-helix transcriptional regulator [Clostridia bacterium]|nr:helix-turn-helix transcriptional regulator [Clostridia bacterium]